MKPVNLIDHPEGGRFKEVFRSASIVRAPGGEERSALTHIYFSLRAGEVSRFHRVRSDEVWNLYRGSLYLYLWDGTPEPPSRIELSAEADCFCHVVPGGVWQAAEPLSGEVLVGCSVGPGFEFSDFELIDPKSEQAAVLRGMSPGMARLAGGTA